MLGTHGRSSRRTQFNKLPSSTAPTTDQATVVDRAVSTKFVAHLRPADLHRPSSSEFLHRRVAEGHELARKTVPSRSSPTKTQLEAAVMEKDLRIGSADAANVFFVATSGTRMSSPATFKGSVVREPSPLSSCGRRRRRRVAGIRVDGDRPLLWRHRLHCK
ncbi:hypothetical protein TIFTF001_051061 [Ficus carica]|uniref:Uncharacterized protein n=1 Tax=Ficus carica TaxID=3494 RepID=A0AA87YZ81_FICCA|nr:hypothetical protein TIFTF001_051061 [Ficus carica]